MSEIKRVLRPYRNISAFQDILNQTFFNVDGKSYETDSSVQIDREIYSRASVEIEFAKNSEAFSDFRTQLFDSASQAGIDSSQLELAVVASSPYLKIAQLVFRKRLSELGEPDRLVNIGNPPNGLTRPKALLSPHAGCNLDAYVSLAVARSQAALQPWRKGTWLSQIGIKLKTELGAVGFVPQVLTQQMKKKFEIPDGTLRFVRLDDSALSQDVTEDALALFVDEEVLTRLNSSATSLQSRAFQRQLFVDAMDAILDAAISEAADKPPPLADIEGSLIHKVVAMIAGKHPGENADSLFERQSQFFRMAISHREKFMAHVEDHCGITRELSKALGE
jgi:hypothetical protein